MKSYGRHFVSTIFGFVVALVASGPLGGTAAAGVLYDQPADFPASNSPSAWTSTFDPVTYGSIYTTYDNFSLTSAATIGSLTWQGFSFNVNTLSPTTTSVSFFNVDFYANSGSGTPGALLFSENIGFTESAAGTIDFFGNGQIETIDNYTATLSTGFTAAANTTYWVSIQAVTDYPAFWTWTSGEGGDGLSYQMENPDYGDDTGVRSGDRAFSLSSVPEPSSLVMCSISALAGLMTFARGRRKRA